MHILKLFLAFIQKLCLPSFHFFQKSIKWGGGLEKFPKINKRGGDEYSVLESKSFSQMSLVRIHFHENSLLLNKNRSADFY